MIFLYPLRLVPLLLTLVASFLIWLPFKDIFSFLVTIESFPLVLTVLLYFKYLFKMLERTANGYADPPVLTFDFYRPFDEMRPYQLLLVLLFVISLAAMFREWQLDYVAAALVCYTLLVLPAFIGLLGLRNGFYASLNPVKLIRFIHRTGIAYLAMLVLLATTLGLTFLFYQNGTALFGAIFLTLYCLDLVFLWIGRVIHARREALEFYPEKSPEREADQAAKALLQERKYRLHRVFKQRRRENVLAILLAYIEAEQDTLAAHAWYHAELMCWDNKRLALKHAPFYVKSLRIAGKNIIADLIQQECRAIDPDFPME